MLYIKESLLACRSNKSEPLPPLESPCSLLQKWWAPCLLLAFAHNFAALLSSEHYICPAPQRAQLVQGKATEVVFSAGRCAFQTGQRGRASRQTGEQPRGPTEHTGEACSSESKGGPGYHTNTGRPTSLSELSTSVRKGLGLVCWFSYCREQTFRKAGRKGIPQAYGTWNSSREVRLQDSAEALGDWRDQRRRRWEGRWSLASWGEGARGAGWLAVVGPPLQMRGNEIV